MPPNQPPSPPQKPLSSPLFQAGINTDGYLAHPDWIRFNNVANKNLVLTAAGLGIKGGSGSPTVTAANAIRTLVGGYLGVPSSPATDMPAIAGGNLAFDDGTVPVTTLSCRMYTFIATVSQTTGALTYSVINGADFPKHRPVKLSDINLGDGSQAVIGYMYVKNESSAVFIPGTTHLDATGITVDISDAFGSPIFFGDNN